MSVLRSNRQSLNPGDADQNLEGHLSIDFDTQSQVCILTVALDLLPHFSKLLWVY